MACAGQRIRERSGGLSRTTGVRDDDPGAGAGEKASGRCPDAAGAADDKREAALEGLRHGNVSYLIGGTGRFAAPGAMTNEYSSVYQGAFTSGAGGVSLASCWR